MIWNRLMGEFVDVIEWTDPSNDTLVYRFDRHGNEIKYGAQLTVRESQVAIFVSEGRLADVFQPGMYTLETKNMPILTTLESWPHGFKSPFKAEVYFLSMRQFTGLKWGTKHPVTLRDADFAMVRLRAFGTYVIRIDNPETFLKEIVGTDGHFTLDEITDQLRDIIVSRFGSTIGGSGIPVLDLASNYDDLGRFLTNSIRPEFAQYGLNLVNVFVENISLPPEVEAVLDKRTSMGVIGDLKRYAQFQAAEAMASAAANPGGTAAAGIGMGMGFGMAKHMSDALSGTAGPGAATAVPGAPLWFLAIGGQQQGPFTADELGRHAREGKLTRETLVWTEGLAEWTIAGDVAALKPLFAQTPPPLPPTS